MKNFKKVFIIILIVFSITILLSVKTPLLKKVVLYQNIPKYYKGDLFEINKVLNFKNKIYKVKGREETHTIENAEIITMGDSFFEANYGSAVLPQLLEDEFNYKVFNLPRDVFSKYSDNPLEYLEKTGYKKGEKKYILVEIAEKYSIERSIDYTESTNPNNESTQNTNILYSIKNFIPKESINQFFHNSLVIAPIDELGNTFKFNLLKEIHPKTPVYAKDQSQVFYYEDLIFANRVKSVEDITVVANNIAYLRDNLKKLYNLDLVYMIVPNKYSIYGYKTENPVTYDNYIPRVTKELLNRDVKTFDLYSQYITLRDDNLLYYKGDTHYTPIGKKVALDNIVKIIKENEAK
jgi:hypothetical protein